MATSGDDLSRDGLATTYVFLILGTLAVILRFWARWIARKAGFWWDDWLSLASLPFFWALCGVTFYWVHIGLGQHIKDVAPVNRPKMPLILFTVNPVYNTALTLVKFSVLMFYIRVFRTVRVYRYAFHLTGLLLIAWWIGINCLAIFTCWPVEKSWKKIPGHCADTQHTFLAATTTNIFADVVLLLLPIPMLWKLHLETNRKIALLGIFVCGYCVVILSILRLRSVTRLGATLKDDLSYNIAYPNLLVISEVGTALISSCLPSIVNLLKHTVGKKLPWFKKKINTSHDLSGPGGSHIGQVGNPIDERNKKGFVELSRLKNGSTTSKERLFKDSIGVDRYGYTTTQASKGDVEQGIPKHAIRVKEDIHISR